MATEIDGVNLEGDVLTTLNSYHISENVPPVAAHAEVEGRRSVADILWPKSHPEQVYEFRSHTHYSLVEKKSAFPSGFSKMEGSSSGWRMTAL